MWIDWDYNYLNNYIRIGYNNIGENILSTSYYYSYNGWKYQDITYLQFISDISIEWIVNDKYENKICYENNNLYNITINNSYLMNMIMLNIIVNDI